MDLIALVLYIILTGKHMLEFLAKQTIFFSIYLFPFQRIEICIYICIQYYICIYYICVCVLYISKLFLFSFKLFSMYCIFLNVEEISSMRKNNLYTKNRLLQSLIPTNIIISTIAFMFIGYLSIHNHNVALLLKSKI